MVRRCIIFVGLAALFPLLQAESSALLATPVPYRVLQQVLTGPTSTADEDEGGSTQPDEDGGASSAPAASSSEAAGPELEEEASAPAEEETTTTTEAPKKSKKGKKGKKGKKSKKGSKKEETTTTEEEVPTTTSPPTTKKGKKGAKKTTTTTTTTATPEETTSSAPGDVTTTTEGDDVEGSTTADADWQPQVRNGKFINYHEIIEYLVRSEFDRTFAGMLVFQIIKFRNGDASIEKKLVDRLVSALKAALPELRVLATLRKRLKTGLKGRDRDQARGLAARTVTTAIRHFYYAADEEGIPIKMIIGVINAMHTFTQASYTDPLRDESPTTTTPSPPSDKKRANRDAFSEELERLLDELENEILDDFDKQLNEKR